MPSALPLTEFSATALAVAIRSGETTSAAVVEAHIAVLTRGRAVLNHIVADRFDQALAEARAADAQIASGVSGSDPVAADRPLFGVPFTVKESIALAGMPNAAGVVARAGYRATDTAAAVQRVIDAGAIALGVTNTSELTLEIEASNPLYGRTSNPYDVRCTAGGSSGGEGAAVGCGGSPFGIGSDIGGSIRIPALFCGVFGHKPSSGLVPTAGLWPRSVGNLDRVLAVGPIARCASDLMPLLRILSGPAAVLGDPTAVSIDGLQITTITDSGQFGVSRDMHHARERAVGALLALGARERRVRLRGLHTALLPYLAALQDASGAEEERTSAQLREAGEDVAWGTVFGRSSHSVMTRAMVARDLIAPGGGSGPPPWVLRRARELAAEITDAIGDGVLLHPAHPRTAPRHGSTVARPWLMMPAAIFNLAGVPATEVPLGLSDSGLPAGIQVAAAHGADHRGIAVALELEHVFGGWVPPRGAGPE